MNQNYFLLILFLCLLSIHCEEEQQFIELTDADFQTQVLDSQDPWIVYFYSSNANSKKFFQVWEKVPKRAKEIQDYGLKFGQVNVKENPGVVQQLTVKGTPVLKYFRQETKYVELVGSYMKIEWTLESVAKWCVEQYEFIVRQKRESAERQEQEAQRNKENREKRLKLLEIHKEGHVSLLTDQNYNELIKKEDIPKFIFFYANNSKKCEPIHQIWETLAEKYDSKVEFAKIDIAIYNDLAKEFKIRLYPTLKLIITDEKQFIFSGERTITLIEEFLIQKVPKLKIKSEL